MCESNQRHLEPTLEYETTLPSPTNLKERIKMLSMHLYQTFSGIPTPTPPPPHPHTPPFIYHWLFVELMSRYWVLHYRYFIFFINIHVFSIPCFDYAVNKCPPTPFNHNRQNQLSCGRLYTCDLI